MSNSNHGFQGEERRIRQVIAKIGEKIEQLQIDVGELKSKVVENRKNFWDDVTVNFDNHEDAQETLDSIRQQSMVLAEMERHHKHSSESLSTLRRLHESPYFGRVDFTETGYPETDRIYIGIASFVDNGTHEHYVYDWRAPISSLFYDYALGPAEFTAPMGTVQGTVDLKRQFVIRHGELKFMFDTGETIGDEVLQQALGRSSDTQMRSIVATIQKEQNAIIRHVRGRTVIVQGAAGSGKTSVALQRVAYLLYKYRETLNAGNMVLFSPNPIFSNYVSNVLPELGEANIQQTTFQDYLDRRLGAGFQVEDAYSQLEYMLTASDGPAYRARQAGIRFKASADFYRMIESYVELLKTEGMLFEDLQFRGNTLITGEQIAERFYTGDTSGKLNYRLEALRSSLNKELIRLEREERVKDWVQDEVELLDKDDFQEAFEALYRTKKMRGDTFNDAQDEYEVLSKKVVHDHFAPLRKKVKRLKFIDIPGLYKRLFTDERLLSKVAEGIALPEDWREVCSQTAEKLERGELPYEDATPLLLLKELIEGFRTVTNVRHVLIDEGQDYSPFQYLFMKRLFPHSKFTILGDFNQAILMQTARQGSFEAIARIFGDEETETFQLTKSYRSTKEIVEFTRGMLPGGEAIQPFNRSGERPVVVTAANRDELLGKMAEHIARFKAEGAESVAVICKTAAESEQAYEALKPYGPLQLIGITSRSITEGTMVIPAYLAKGVEFDAVLIYDASAEQYGQENERKLFYTACTRAMHHLRLYTASEPTPFIAGLDPVLYERQ